MLLKQFFAYRKCMNLKAELQGEDRSILSALE